MSEPVYKQTMPYVPIEVKTHRDAYAATLHVLFKHIADFHICVVKTFSKKYGIPEDEIIQTIQESPEFKNMEVDPALHPVHADPVHADPVHTDPVHTDPVHTDPVHTDPVHTDPVHSDAIESLGYKIASEPIMTPLPEDAVPKKRNQTAETDVVKKRVVKKKQVPVSETVVVASERESDQAPLLSQNDPTVTVSSEKKKVIKAAPLMAAPLVAAPLVAAPLMAAPLMAAPLVDCVKPKIIKKLKST
jgi:hypothetical protein